jgi:hypothetical protein
MFLQKKMGSFQKESLAGYIDQYYKKVWEGGDLSGERLLKATKFYMKTTEVSEGRQSDANR